MLGLLKVLKTAYRKVNPTYHHVLAEKLAGCDTILDLGCGTQSPLAHLPRHRLRVGVDAFEPSVEKAKEAKIHDQYFCCDLLETEKLFPPRSFDAVIALDVLEHFPKDKGWELLAMMERLARKRVVLFTPNGFLPQGEVEKNPWQLHVSGWTVLDLAPFGYAAEGINGWKPLRKSFAEPRLRPAFLGDRLADLTQPLVRTHPAHAFQLLFVKNI